MRLSVIVPVKDDPRLVHCLRALDAQTVERDAFEIIVVDNGLSPSMRGLAERFSSRYLVEEAGGSYAARARGVAEARGEILAFTDADCVPPPNWLAMIDSLFGDLSCQVVLGPSSSAEDFALSRWVERIDEARWQSLARMDRVAYCDTRNLAVRRGVLDAVPFDPAFRQAGDVDLGIRLYRAGIPIRMEPSLRVLHHQPRSVLQVWRRAVRRGRGLARLERKHGALSAPIGQRPVLVGGRDLKGPILRVGRLPVLRWLAIGTTSLLLVALTPALELLARAGTTQRGERLFVVFERLSLLLGRLLG